MSKRFFDFEDGDFGMSISDNMSIDSDGDFMIRMSNNMVLGMDTGEMHFISGWSDEKDD